MSFLYLFHRMMMTITSRPQISTIVFPYFIYFAVSIGTNTLKIGPTIFFIRKSGHSTIYLDIKTNKVTNDVVL